MGGNVGLTTTGYDSIPDRRLGVDLPAYLTWAFVRLGTHAAKYELSAAELTPAAYKRAHPSPS